MQVERRARLAAMMQEEGLDGLVLLGHANLEYVGVSQPCCDAGRMHHAGVMAIFPADATTPYVWTPFPDAVAPDIPKSRVFAPLSLEYEEGLPAFVRALHSTLPHPRRVGFDEMSAAMMAGLPGLLQNVEICDGAVAAARARLIKTRDEVECIRRAQQINELAMQDVYRAFRPGVRQNELTAIFLERALELGTDGVVVDTIWSVSPRSSKAAPFTLNGEVAFPQTSSDAFLREGDLVLSDTGISWRGYHSDFGKTWICSDDPRPDAELRRCFDGWSEVMSALYGVIRPGATVGDLMRTAAAVEKKHAFAHFYLGHGIGLGSAEPPFIGSDRGMEVEGALELAPGMVFVLEPVIWREGVGGYRSEEIIHVTPHGFERLTTFGYAPFQ
jgi:Xaa-Pro aminopeptidase